MSGLSSSAGVKGALWQGVLKVYLDVGKEKPEIIELKHSELLRMEELIPEISLDDTIEEVEYWGNHIETADWFCKMEECLYNLLHWGEPKVYHAYLVFKAHGKWYSLEKDDEGLKLQRAADKKYVTHHRVVNGCRQKRPSPEHRNTKSDQKEKWTSKKAVYKIVVREGKIGDLISWMHSTRQLDNSYSLCVANCQKFTDEALDTLNPVFKLCHYIYSRAHNYLHDEIFPIGLHVKRLFEKNS